MTTTTTPTVPAGELAERLDAGPATLIDVRTPAEFAEVHIPGATNVPLDRLDPAPLARCGGPIYLVCRTGTRSRQACDRLVAAGVTRAVVVDGGVSEWEQAGRPVVRGRKAVALDRQVRIAAGSLVVLGTVLGVVVHPGFLGLAGFVGAGLVFSGVTDTCGMGSVLARMPWNRRAAVQTVSFAVVGAAVLTGAGADGQDKSVRPGINDPFKNPDLPEWVTKFEGESRETFDKRKEVVAACKLKPGMTVADVGAGTGLYTRLFATEVGATGTVYAVDISRKFLDHIAAAAKKQNLGNVQTMLGAGVSAELPENAVDVVFVCDTYHHFEFPQRMMASVFKALKPGGRVVVVDFARVPGKSSEWVLGHVRAGQDVVEREIADAGFKKVGEVKDLLNENHLVVFEKPKVEGK